MTADHAYQTHPTVGLAMSQRLSLRLTPGAEQLAVGEPFLVFRLVEFHEGQSLTGLVQPHFQRRFGPLAVTYALQPYQDGACRLVVRLNAGATTPLQRVRRVFLAWGDLIMMRKQVLTLKWLAERNATLAAALGSAPRRDGC